MSQPQIVIDSDEELHIVCRLLFYNIPGFYPNAKKLYRVCQEEGYSFRLQNITKWIKHQYSYQIYRHPLPCKAEASFSKIKIPNKVHQCDILLHAFSRGMQQYNVTIRVVDLYSFESLAFIKAFTTIIAQLTYKVHYAIEGRDR